MITGQISKIETLGLVDGPGIRTVIFLSGCKLRCQFCHNPEMWTTSGATLMTSQEVMKVLLRYKSYYKNNGGVTFSGGEPLLQPKFLLEILTLCKKNNINTCLDTAGVGAGDYENILKVTDLVILDIKHIDENEYYKITGCMMNYFNEFLYQVQAMHKPLWLRQVIIPGINDNKKYIKALAHFIKSLDNVKKVELLPYHTMGISKYNDLNISYPLSHIKAMDKGKCEQLSDYLQSLLYK